MRKARILITKTKELIVADPVAAVVVAMQTHADGMKKSAALVFIPFSFYSFLLT